MTATILIAGCGDLGCTLGRLLVDDGYRVVGLRRSAGALPGDIQAFPADVTRPETLHALPAVEPDILVYCVAADAQSDDSYRTHYVDGLRNILGALAKTDSLRHVFFVSSTRVYGQSGDEAIDENTPALPADFGGERLLQGEALLKAVPCRSTVLRLSGIYGPGRHRLLKLARQPQAWPDNNPWTNRIHIDDASGFIAELIRRSQSGANIEDCYLVTDGCPTPQYEVLHWLAKKLGIDAGMISSPPVHGGKRLMNTRMRATGFVLRHADYRAGYGAEMQRLLSTE